VGDNSFGEVHVSSTLGASVEDVWRVATTPEGINAELGPWLRMTLPPGVARLDPATVPIGRSIGRSWILLLGLLPVDYDDVTLVRLEPGRGFLERSPMLTQRSWEHERTLEATGPTCCTLTDRVRFEPRALVPVRVVKPIVEAVFRHRHAQLRARWPSGAAR
jgi:ligand-binding SRPBCC domain-containing protein